MLEKMEHFAIEALLIDEGTIRATQISDTIALSLSERISAW